LGVYTFICGDCPPWICHFSTNDRINTYKESDVVLTDYKQLSSTRVGVQVRGLVLLDNLLYVLRWHSSQIDIMDPVTLTSVGSVSVPSMTGRSGSMAACPIQKSLYVTCYKKKEMLKIRVAGAHLCLSVCLSVCLSACLSVCPSVCPSFASVCVSATGLNLFVICIFTVFVKYCRPNQSHLPNFVTF